MYNIFILVLLLAMLCAYVETTKKRKIKSRTIMRVMFYNMENLYIVSRKLELGSKAAVQSAKAQF